MYKLILLSTFLAMGCMAKENDEKKLTRIVSKTGDRIAAKQNLQFYGFGTEGPGRIKGYILQFQTVQKVDINQARSLLIRVAEELKQTIKASIQKENLDWNPDDPNFFFISIGFNDKDGRYITEEGYIAHATISKGRVDLELYDPKTTFFVPIQTETYAEAYQKVFGSLGD